MFILFSLSYFTPPFLSDSCSSEARILMRSTASSVVSKLRPIRFSNGRWVGTMKPTKQTNDNPIEAPIESEKAEPIAAFSRPPPLTPFLGPLVAYTMVESWNKRDNADD